VRVNRTYLNPFPAARGIKGRIVNKKIIIDLLRNEFRSEIMIFRAKTTKREEVNTAYSLTSGELFAAEKS